MMTPLSFPISLNKTWRRAVIVGALSSVGLLSGQIPEFAKNSFTLSFSSSAYAQSAVSDTEVAAFAQTVWEIEPTRRSKMRQIQSIVGSKDIPDIVCGRPSTIEALPEAAEPLARQLCDKYVQVIKKNGLSSARFYEISGMVSNAALKSRIDQQLIEIQKRQRSR